MNHPLSLVIRVVGAIDCTRHQQCRATRGTQHSISGMATYSCVLTHNVYIKAVHENICKNNRLDYKSKIETMALFAYLIIRLFQLVFSAATIFLSHNKLAGIVFRFSYTNKYSLPKKHHRACRIPWL